MNTGENEMRIERQAPIGFTLSPTVLPRSASHAYADLVGGVNAILSEGATFDPGAGRGAGISGAAISLNPSTDT